MLRKSISLFLLMVLLLCAFAGCGESLSHDTSAPDHSEATSSTADLSAVEDENSEKPLIDPEFDTTPRDIDFVSYGFNVNFDNIMLWRHAVIVESKAQLMEYAQLVEEEWRGQN